MIEKTEKGVSYMTSDAKVGLLLGLVFIVIIAFLINGLPGLLSNGSSNAAVDTRVPGYQGGFGLSERAEEAIDWVNGFDPSHLKPRDSEIDSPENNDPRFVDENPVAGGGGNGSSDKKTTVSTNKFYVVKSGDSLGRIAIKVYGKEIGNKLETVDLIYQANSSILDSPDDISIDQKLIMPLLGGNKKLPGKKGRATVRKTGSPNEDVLLKTGFFERAGDAFKDVFSKKNKSSSLSVYVVKDHENLWSISSKRLGKGSRCNEIQKLNIDILKGSIVIKAGMKLKIPQK
jgi:nucleoid-associated protein YgaU